jgi:hypothetical protein
MSRKIVRRGKSFLQKLLSIVKEFRLVARSLIEVMKKGRMEKGGGCGGCCTVKKGYRFSGPQSSPGGEKLN